MKKFIAMLLVSLFLVGSSFAGDFSDNALAKDSKASSEKPIMTYVSVCTMVIGILILTNENYISNPIREGFTMSSVLVSYSFFKLSFD